jgi:peroxiredoxin
MERARKGYDISMEKLPSSEKMQQHKSQGIFQSQAFIALFGRSVASLVTRLLILAMGLGTLLIIVVGLLSPVAANGSRAAVGLQVGNAAPNFTLSTLDGRRVSLSDYRGKPVMLNFWYSTCPGCLAETSDIQRVYAAQRAAGKDVVILGVNILDDAQAAQQFVRRHGLTYQIVLDDHQRVEALYNLEGAPTSYFIDRKGIIRSVVIGPVDATTLQQRLAEIS